MMAVPRGGCWLPDGSHEPVYVGSIPTPATNKREILVTKYGDLVLGIIILFYIVFVVVVVGLSN